MPFPPIRLGVNIDHVATIRNARGGLLPDPVRAAHAAIEAGADGITAHLREDRRHIHDEDMARLKAEIDRPLNFEMAATPEMLAIALKIAPHACCLVPEKREERTTEGGLDVAGNVAALTPFIARLKDAGIRVSLFIEPSPKAIDASARLETDKAEREHQRLVDGAGLAAAAGLEVHAGHGLDFRTAEKLAHCHAFVEFNIGHYLVGEAVFIGLGESVRQMKAAMIRGRKFR